MKFRSYGLMGGYLLLILGITALVMQMVGIYWVFLRWLELGGGLFSFVVKILMILSGFILIVLSRTDWQEERRSAEEDD
jgi:hypothetical protein